MSKTLSVLPYRERVLPGISYYLASLLPAVGAYFIALPFGTTLALVIGISLLVLLYLLSWSLASVIEISATELAVGSVRIPRKVISKVSEVPISAVFAERSTNLDSRAFTKFKIGVKGLVKIELQDPADPTPYWLIATRNPDLVTQLLNRV